MTDSYDWRDLLPDTLRRTVERTPRSVEELRDRLRGWFGIDPLAEATALVDYARHFDDYVRLQSSLLEYRFVLALLLARRFEFFGALADGGRTPSELAETTGLTREAVETFAAIFVTRDLVEYDDATIRATDFAETFLAGDSRRSATSMLDLLNAYTDSLGEIADGLASGEVPASLDVRDDPPATDDYLLAVNDYLDRAGRELLLRLRLPEVDHFIAGSMGVSFSSLVLGRWPDAKVTYGCLDHLTERIPKLRRRYDVPPERVVGTHPHGGEPEHDTWGRESFDLVFLTKKMILDPKAGMGEAFARKALDVLEPGGVAIFWEAVHRDAADATSEAIALESFFDVGLNPRATPKSRADFRELLVEMGYDSVEFVEVLGESTSFAVARIPTS